MRTIRDFGFSLAEDRGVQFVPVWQGFKNDARLAIGPTHASESHIKNDLEIRLTEPRIVSHRPLIHVLRDFVGLANSIIKQFRHSLSTDRFPVNTLDGLFTTFSRREFRKLLKIVEFLSWLDKT